MKKTIDILKEIIEIPSYVDGENNEKELIKYIVNFIKNNTKYKVVLQTVEGERKNILVYSAKNPKITLFGHMDTVLPKAETKNPFKSKIIGDKIYGLGSVDMKSGLAIMLNIAQNITNKNLAFVFSVDEEYEFKGSLKLQGFKEFNPEFIINVEPTNNKILNGCRGITEFSFIAHGKSAHSGLKKYGVNAIEKSVKLIRIFQKKLTKLDSDKGKTSVNLAYMHGGTFKKENNQKIEISDLGMVVPNYAKLNCEIRIANSKINQEFIKIELNKIAKKIGIRLSDFNFKFYLESMFTPKSKLKNFEKSIRNSGEKVEYADISSSGYYEVQLLEKKWQSNAVIFGPGPVELSHCVDEYVYVSSINKSEKIITHFIKENI